MLRAPSPTATLPLHPPPQSPSGQGGLSSDSWEVTQGGKGAEWAGAGTGSRGPLPKFPERPIHQSNGDNQRAQPAQDTDYSPGTINTGNKSGKGPGRRAFQQQGWPPCLGRERRPIHHSERRSYLGQ